MCTGRGCCFSELKIKIYHSLSSFVECSYPNCYKFKFMFASLAFLLYVYKTTRSNIPIAALRARREARSSRGCLVSHTFISYLENKSTWLLPWLTRAYLLCNSMSVELRYSLDENLFQMILVLLLRVSFTCLLRQTFNIYIHTID